MSDLARDMSELAFDLVVPTVGRPSLHRMLEALAAEPGPRPQRIVLVDDRRHPEPPLLDHGAPAAPAGIAERIVVVASGGRGPAAARNAGWRAATAPWIVFLDDDVLPPAGWPRQLVEDLAELPAEVAASQARIRVPLPRDCAPTDWERNVAGLEVACWATADMAYRRHVLLEVGGFDERFPRAYREDADLGLRVVDAGYRIVTGARTIVHPVRPAGATVSLRLQAGNADDVMMRALHGSGWQMRAGVPKGRRRWHVATTAALGAWCVGLVGSRPGLARGGGLAWAALTAQFAWRRIAPGPRTPQEIGRMLATSLVLPLLAVAHTVRGIVGLPRRLDRPGPAPPARPSAVLFDRDGTLVRDVPYNGDPAAVEPVPGAREALDRLRAAGIPTAVVTNQSGIGRGLVSSDQMAAVNARIEALLGPVGPWVVCPHMPDDGCACRKPSPVLIEQAAARLGVAPRDCVMIGDIGADVEAALAAGARPLLVPTEATRAEERSAAPEVVSDLGEAVDRILGRAVPPAGRDAS